MSPAQYQKYTNRVALQPDGKTLIAGWFDTVNRVGRTNIARVNADGSLGDTFNSGTEGRNLNPGTSGNTVYTSAVQADRKVLSYTDTFESDPPFWRGTSGSLVTAGTSPETAYKW